METEVVWPVHLLLRTSLAATWLLTSPPLNGDEWRVETITFEHCTYSLFPAASNERPKIPSPHETADGAEILTACTEQGHYVLVPVTITPGITTRPWEVPLEIDGEDFPTLARTGLHSEAELDRIRSITGRSPEEVTELGRPGRLSTSGFMAEDEDVLSVIKGDNQLATKLGLTHPELARPLLHVCNLLRVIHRESGQRRTNTFFYGGMRLTLEVEFTRGGQKSIFNDGLEGAWGIKLRRELEPTEAALLDRAYAHLEPTQRESVRTHLTQVFTGEMQPFYIYRYGFYEGHTGWRTDPIAIAFMFGLRALKEIEAAFPGQLHAALTEHFVSNEARPQQSPKSDSAGTL
jgi:hypothetical protein